jgi:hypothetical protein
MNDRPNPTPESDDLAAILLKMKEFLRGEVNMDRHVAKLIEPLVGAIPEESLGVVTREEVAAHVAKVFADMSFIRGMFPKGEENLAYAVERAVLGYQRDRNLVTDLHRNMSSAGIPLNDPETGLAMTTTERVAWVVENVRRVPRGRWVFRVPEQEGYDFVFLYATKEDMERNNGDSFLVGICHSPTNGKYVAGVYSNGNDGDRWEDGVLVQGTKGETWLGDLFDDSLEALMVECEDKLREQGVNFFLSN